MAVFNHGLPIKANVIQGEGGTDTSKDTVTPDSLREGYTAHDAAGQEITGTIPDYSGGSPVEMTSPDGATLNTAGTYCEGNIEVVPKLQSKTATTGEIVTADAGYVGLSEVDTNPVYEAGKKSEYDAFWDAYQQNGERIHYNYAFLGDGWTDQSFKPKYDIQIGNASNGAGNGNMAFIDSRISDIGKTLKDRGVVLDTSRCNNFNQMFQNAKTKTLPAISAESANDLPLTFYACSYLETIQMLIVTERVGFDRTFFACGLLVSLTIEGTIGQNGFNVSWSPLNKASLTSIVNALSSTTTGLTVTVRASAVKKAFETSEGANDGMSSEEWLTIVATKPNWTINAIDP